MTVSHESIAAIKKHWLDARGFVLILGLWIAVQAGFSYTAFRVDEPTILAITRQISINPLDPYGFEIDWSEGLKPAFTVLANPPLVPAWLAAWSLIFPWNEISLHLAMLPFSLLALYAFRRLAGAVMVDRLLPVAMLCCSPGFFIGSQVVMPDVAMLSLMLTSVASAMLYDHQGGKGPLIVSLISGFLTPLAKYNGVVLIVLLGWLFLRSRRKTGFAFIVAAPILSVVFWSGYSWIMYGAPHIVAMAAFQRDYRIPFLLLVIGVVCAVSLGALPLCLHFLVPRLYAKHGSIVPLILILTPGTFWIARKMAYPVTSAVLFALGIALFLHVIVITIEQSWRSIGNWRSESAFLVVWIFACLVFQGGQMFASVRYVLILAPPIILLFLRQCAWQPPTQWMRGFIAANLVFVLALATGDAITHNAYRRVVFDHIRPLLTRTGGKFYFAGHWGFQYYAETIGGRHVDVLGSAPPYHAGDLLVVAATACPPIIRPALKEGQRADRQILSEVLGWTLRTIDCNSAAFFYGTLLTLCPRPAFLPWGLSDGPGETFIFYVVSDAPPE